MKICYGNWMHLLYYVFSLRSFGIFSIRNGDGEKRKNFEEQALIHFDALYNMALKLARNAEDAEDLVQDTIFRAYKYFYQYEYGTSCKAWLYTILRNTFINRYRKKSKEPKKVAFHEVETFVDLIKNPEIPWEEIQEKLQDQILGDEISEALEQLSEDIKNVVLLADLEGFTYEEIASVMNCPIGTVRSRLSRGRKTLQKYLVDYALKEGIIKKKG